MSDADRRAAVSRETAETTIDVTLAIDGDGGAVVDTDIGFFSHMLEAFVKHGLLDLTVQCDGDLHIDDHYIVEDATIVLDEAFIEALGDKCGIVRYASRKVPLDEAVASVVVDVSDRPFFELSGGFSQPYADEFTSHMAEHFAMSLATNADLVLHAGVEGDNAHHEVEMLFKAFARSPDDVTRVGPRRSDMLGTRGKL